jgi:hypothetical protein
MPSDHAERVIYNRINASIKVTAALYAVEDAVNAIENTISALRQYIIDNQRDNHKEFLEITNLNAAQHMTRAYIVATAMAFHSRIDDEYYPLLHDLGLFATFIYDKQIIDKKLHKKLAVERNRLLKLIQQARGYENQLSVLL